MRLFPRLVLLGAALPGATAAVIFAGGVQVMHTALEDELDHALLAQAAVETASLFDRPAGVHLHLSTSPLLDEVRQFAPRAAIYDAAGARITVYPDAQSLPAQLPTTTTATTTATTLTTSNDGHDRRLEVPVRHPQTGARYTLVLSAARAGILATTTTMARVAAASVLVLTAVLAVLCWLWAGRLTRRVATLQQHMQRVAHGHFDPLIDDDDSDDEVRALRDGIAAATTELGRQRDARERFIAEAAHELRTPLASMRVALDLALRRASRRREAGDVVDDAVVADLVAALEDTRSETGRLTRLAQVLLEVTAARSAPQIKDRVDVVEIACAAIAGRAAEAKERSLSLTLTSSADRAVVIGDGAALRRVLDNLIDNALKHARSTITVQLSIRDDVEVVVVDDGAGIAAVDVEAVFAPFHHDARDQTGVGLGLTLVKEIVQRHDGDVFAKAGPGGVVGFTLPRA